MVFSKLCEAGLQAANYHPAVRQAAFCNAFVIRVANLYNHLYNPAYIS
jgi:hypothetical protein